MKPSRTQTVLPLIVLSVLVLMIVGTVVWASRLDKIFEAMLNGARLPTLTRYIIGGSRWLGDYWWLVLLPVVLVFLACRHLFGFKGIVLRRIPTLGLVGVLVLVFVILVIGLVLPMIEIVTQMNA